MLLRFLALFVLVGTTFAQTTTPLPASPISANATVEVWPEGKMPGNGAMEAERRRRGMFEPALLIFTLTPIYEACAKLGYPAEGDAIQIKGWPVQFSLSFPKLAKRFGNGRVRRHSVSQAGG